MPLGWRKEGGKGKEKSRKTPHLNLKFHIIHLGLSLNPGALLGKFRNGLSPVWDGSGKQWQT